MPNHAKSGQMPEVLSLQQMRLARLRCVKLRTDEEAFLVPVRGQLAQRSC